MLLGFPRCLFWSKIFSGFVQGLILVIEVQFSPFRKVHSLFWRLQLFCSPQDRELQSFSQGFFRTSLEVFYTDSLSESISRWFRCGSWTNLILATSLPDRAEQGFSGAPHAGLLSVPVHLLPPGISFYLQTFDNVKIRHVLESCTAVAVKRVELGIQDFLDGCLQAGRSKATAFKNYILGLDQNGEKVDLGIYFKRGASLHELTKSWLATWEDPADVV